MRARIKAGVRYLLVPHTARPGGATSFVVSVTSKEEIRLSPPLSPWKKLAAPIVDWPLGAGACAGPRAADWRNAPQISLVNTSGAPCAAVVVLMCGKQSAIAGGVPLQLLQLQVAHNSNPNPNPNPNPNSNHNPNPNPNPAGGAQLEPEPEPEPELEP
jgi:hypothetical protein